MVSTACIVIATTVAFASLLPNRVHSTVAEWRPEGIAIGDSCCGPGPYGAPDGSGGAYFSVGNIVSPYQTIDIYVFRVLGSGKLAPGWPVRAGGQEDQEDYGGRCVADGQGGVLVLWSADAKLRLQRLDSTGRVFPNWPVDGTLASSDAWSGVHVSDGAGGAFMALERWDYDIELQRIDSSGVVATGWPTDGLPVSTLPAVKVYPVVAASDSGSAIVVWSDMRSGSQNLNIYAQRMMADGSFAPGWPTTGIPVCLAANQQFYLTGDTDGAGGIYVAWSDFRTNPIGQAGIGDDVYLTRILPDGRIAPGWPADGLLVLDGQGTQQPFEVRHDGQGGAFVLCEDAQDTPGTYLHRFLGDGTRAPGWPPRGVRTYGREPRGTPAVVADELGGAYVVTEGEEDDPMSPYLRSTVRVFHVAADGEMALGWPLEGTRVNPEAGAEYAAGIVADGRGGAIVAWNGETQTMVASLLAQSYVSDGVVGVEVALRSQRVEAGAIEVNWQARNLGWPFEPTLERAVDSTWATIGPVVHDTAGVVAIRDTDVVPGGRYGYRLRWLDNGRDRTTAPAWIDVPRQFHLALAGVRPNPTSGPLRVTFTLPDAAPARLELFDLAGRRVAETGVGHLAAGEHVVTLAPERGLRAGVYWLRLIHPRATLKQRALVVH